MQPLFWFNFVVSGEEIPVTLSHHNLSPELSGSYGITAEDGEGRVFVLIDASQPRDRQDRTVAHELVHACLWRKKSLKLHHKKEERIADEIGTSGWRNIKIPKRPRGAVALEKWARKQDSE